jgi:uncharacterized membrane protein YraQ (UPF0718 family)
MSETKKIKSQKIKTIKKNIVFGSIIFVIYLIVFFINPNLALSSAKEAFSILIKTAPILILIFLIMIVVDLFLTPERVKKHFGHEAGLKGWFYAILFGILITGPPYVFYPMLKTMKEQGLSNKFIATFLYNRNVKIPFVPASIYYFGWQYTLIIMILIIIFSIFSGLLLSNVEN